MRIIGIKQFVISVSLLAVQPACAGTYLTFDGNSGVFGNDRIGTLGNFSDSFDLGSFSPGRYLFTGTISSSFQTGQQPGQDVDFSSVRLNNLEFTTASSGKVEFRYIADVVSGISNIIDVQGTSGASGTYSGTINVGAAAVPEPAAWMTMLAGFGIVGWSMRRRRSQAFQRA